MNSSTPNLLNDLVPSGISDINRLVAPECLNSFKNSDISDLIAIGSSLEQTKDKVSRTNLFALIELIFSVTMTGNSSSFHVGKKSMTHLFLFM